jgi:hypothetical protein
LLFALALSAASASSAFPQTTVTTVDIQRLQDTIHDTSQAIGRMRDSSSASRLQAELDTAADEATYLKVKIQKNEPISRDQYVDVRDRLNSIRNRARADVDRRDPSQAEPVDEDHPVSSAGAPVMPAPPDESGYSSERPIRSQNPNEIAVGTEFDVRLQNALSSRTSQVEDRFEATTMVDLRDEGGRVMVPAGSLMRGIVSAVKGATRTDRKGSLAVAPLCLRRSRAKGSWARRKKSASEREPGQFSGRFSAAPRVLSPASSSAAAARSPRPKARTSSSLSERCFASGWMRP